MWEWVPTIVGITSIFWITIILFTYLVQKFVNKLQHNINKTLDLSLIDTSEFVAYDRFDRK